MILRDVRPGFSIEGHRVLVVDNCPDGHTVLYFNSRARLRRPSYERICDECGRPGLDLCAVHRRLEDAPCGYADDFDGAA